MGRRTLSLSGVMNPWALTVAQSEATAQATEITLFISLAFCPCVRQH
jgi:hypothetical protein